MTVRFWGGAKVAVTVRSLPREMLQGFAVVGEQFVQERNTDPLTPDAVSEIEASRGNVYVHPTVEVHV